MQSLNLSNLHLRFSLSQPSVIAASVVIIQPTQGITNQNSSSWSIDPTSDLHLPSTQMGIQVPDSLDVAWQKIPSTIPNSDRFVELDDNLSSNNIVPDSQYPWTLVASEDQPHPHHAAPASKLSIPKEFDKMTDQE
ncbi:hypothetical protein L873DRAFT_1794152 [Choiromyces venosus 120613-1]|uniref:Uncharacterized protein n=1 Tax=Choiromyces venosus 120613-1 TaxID=1336337 RepID=A0A3N4J375_9PEZI|nr:hypothetical protein L873DRAFT_1794152 [Choiromyces venosus 120613-1]